MNEFSGHYEKIKKLKIKKKKKKKYNGLVMTRGVCFFAYNNEQIDYNSNWHNAGSKYVKQHSDVPNSNN